MIPSFGYSREALRWWNLRVSQAFARGARTPFYLFSPLPVESALKQLEGLDFGCPTRHWLSCKTQPLPSLLEWWRKSGRPIEVVSEFEFRAALRAGFTLDEILVNGPAKQRWLPQISGRRLRVHFDSPFELAKLLPLARRQQWRVGLRIRTRTENDPGNPSIPTQFGFEPTEAMSALRQLRRADLTPESVHFHLRTNVASASSYGRAFREVADFCSSARWSPRYVDCGGGLPPHHTRGLDGLDFAAQMDLQVFARTCRRGIARLGGVRELWLENGRFLLAGSGVLVIQVLDAKCRQGIRQLICDGGRTLNALVSTWEDHELLPLQRRAGRTVPTAVYGPTCMAYDRLAFRPMPARIRPGDHLVWFEAGAYHLPWETRFSHGFSEIWWAEKNRMKRIRSAETA
ncbi:MAG: hypothetical protein EXS36_03200 [Pedosphaera sp.]|nr:hypothetical protein [Pedosphaera sp.]